MSRPSNVLAIAVAAATLAGSVAHASADSVLHRCGDHVRCGHVWVPLDRSGQVPGRVRLAVERVAPSARPYRGTLIALAGGPGQSSIDLAFDFAHDAPELAHHPIVVFDPRGVGASGRLRCRSPESLRGDAFVAACAQDLGSRRAFYSTADSIEDIEAVREALGLNTFALEGVSYGTYPALGYARAHPDRVDHLILDSPVIDDAPFDLPSVAAMRRVLGRWCATDCPSIAPLQDLVTLLARFPAQRPPGNPGALTSANVGDVMYHALFASDLNPFVRASIPAALHLAARGDDYALARLSALTFGGGSSDGVRGHSVTSDVLDLATSCEDLRLPWSTADPIAVRRAKLDAAANALDPETIAPFAASTIRARSGISECLGWPEAGDSPREVGGPAPAMPTLVISGEDDIRTPLESATAIAAQIPGATLLSVPNIGHSVLGDSACAGGAVGAFLTGAPIRACATRPPPHVDPLPPELARLAPAGGAAGRPGRVLRAVVLTLRHDIGLPTVPLHAVGLVNGTRSGLVRFSSSRRRDVYRFERVSYVNGVAISGRLVARRFHAGAGTVAVSLYRRRYGTLRLTGDWRIRGRLGGQRVRLDRVERERIAIAGGLSRLPLP